MLLDVSRALMFPGQSYPFAVRLELPQMRVLDDDILFSDIEVQGLCTGTGESVGVAGTIKATVNAHCARCTGDVAQAMEVSFDEVFSKTPDPDDPDLYPLDGHTVELSDLVKDQLLLELPMRFVCSDDCQGLCPVCGVNRNIQRCTCQESGQVLRGPFSALSEMLSNDEEV